METLPKLPTLELPAGCIVCTACGHRMRWTRRPECRIPGLNIEVGACRDCGHQMGCEVATGKVRDFTKAEVTFLQSHPNFAKLMQQVNEMMAKRGRWG